MVTEVTDIDSPVYRYLPATLLSNWAKSPNQKPVWGEWLHGSLMHCDVTGFTAMNEALASMGNEGAEVMAKILNRFFERMLRIGEQWNGIQMKFGGDAMLLYFPDAQHALCAAKCGLEMQAAMKEFSKVKVNDGVCQLRMRIGIHSGRFYSVSLGHDKGLLHYLITGPDVNRAADVEPLAEPGQVVVSDETAQLIKDHSRLSITEHKGIWEVERAQALEVSHASSEVLNAPHEVLERYLMPAVANGKASGLYGEHRRATIAFIYLFGLSELLERKGEDEALKQANEYIQMVLSIAERYGGSLLASDVAEHADKIVVTFGAPVSIPDQEGSCLRFAYDLREKVAESNMDLRHQIGINTGFIFAGEIGSSWRREYTTIGDNMNLAARLMVAAGEGNILVSSFTAEKVGDEFILDELEPILVKGKSQPIKIMRLNSVRSSALRQLHADDLSIIGRDKELEQLHALADRVKSSESCSVLISGDAGIGKTALCDVFVANLQAAGWITANSICQSYDIQNAFSAWRYPLQKLCGITEHDPMDKAWCKIESTISKNCPEFYDFAPLIADILLIRNDGNSVVSSLDAKTKRDKRILLIRSLVINISRSTSLCLIFDGIGWMDSSSAQIILDLQKADDEKILFVFTSRNPNLPLNLSNSGINLHQELKSLSDESSLKYVLSTTDLTEDMGNAVVKKARGNPLFLRELSRSGAVEKGMLPDSIYDVIMVRLDNLDVEERYLLRNAAVIGQVFEEKVLVDMDKMKRRIIHGVG
jgi:class 3 adenylate cyclase